MKRLSMLVLAALSFTAQAASATDVHCPSRGPCIAPPAMPEPPVPPVPPAPPPPPPIPDVPEAAHQACAGKAVGSPLSFVPRKGVFMAGTCELDSKGMYFSMKSYHSDN